MPVNVSDFRANPDETINFAARVVGKSKARQKVFLYVYSGGKRFKGVTEIARACHITNVRALQEGAKLAHNHLVVKGVVTKSGGSKETAYKKDATLALYRDRVLRTARKPALAKKYATKQRPHVSGGSSITIRLGASSAKPKLITIDEVESFKRVRGIGPVSSLKLHNVLEKVLKRWLQRILGETHDFTDWGGEQNDLYTTKFRRGASRVAAAFALKGRATKGPLTPKKMGANGDQIGRLIASDAEVFFVVYHSKVEQSVYEHMRAHAFLKNATGRRVYYGVIDGDDLGRLYQAYRKHFPKK